MHWFLKQGNIVDEPADVLVCSANVSLNFSGGVGAELLGRYGAAMQEHLHRQIHSRSPRCARQGEVFVYTGSELPCRAVLHAVAIDGWYQSSVAVIERIVHKCLDIAATQFSAQTVLLTALATGFGNLTLTEFGRGILPLREAQFLPIERVGIVLIEDYRLRELEKVLAPIEVILNPDFQYQTSNS